MAKKPELVKRDLYQEITDDIISVMEQGKVPWQKGWVPPDQSSDQAQAAATFQMPVNATTGRPYQGINPLILWVSKMRNSFTNDAWMTYKQAAELGGNVKKGSKGSLVTYASPYIPKSEEEKAKTEGRDPKAVFVLKGFTVFNLDQIENVPADKLKVSTVPYDPVILKDRTAEIVANAKIDLRHGGDRAYFSPSTDHVQMPHPDQFQDPDGYYRVLYHETTHWSGGKERLNRDLSGAKGSHAYAKEELVAELGSAYMSAQMGIEPDTKGNAAYLQSWLQALKDDKKFIFQAATAASKASDYLLGFENVHELDWASKEAHQWNKEERQSAEKAFETDQAEGRYVGLSIEEYGDFKHRIWQKTNLQEEQAPEAKPSLAA